jgi:hypothetical protein
VVEEGGEGIEDVAAVDPEEMVDLALGRADETTLETTYRTIYTANE